MPDKPKILIIEDNSDDAELLIWMLRQAGLERHVRIINDGGIALKYLKEKDFRAEELVAVFLDLDLPTVGGIQLLEEILLDDRIRHLPVVVMTSSTSPSDKAECERLGVSCFIQKPVTRGSFIKAVEITLSEPRELMPFFQGR